MALEGNRGIRELRKKVGRDTPCAPFEPDLQNSGAQRSDAPYRVTYLPMDRDGLLRLADLENAITDQTAFASLMWSEHETGVLFPAK